MGKGLMYFCIVGGSTVGSYVPVIWHASLFSMASILGGLVGAFVGVWVGFKLHSYYG